MKNRKTPIASILGLAFALPLHGQGATSERVPTVEAPLAVRSGPGRLDREAEELLHLERATEVDAAGLAKSIQSRSFGLGEFGGELWGGGPHYKARFTEGSVELTAALGLAVKVNHGLSFALESIRRGDAVLYSGVARAPEADGNTVRYALAPGITEFYDVRVDGIEQRYVFETLPPGTGDLIVRGAFQTNFPRIETEAAGGLRLSVPDVAGLSYGAVTGIDSTGATVAGELRLAGGYLELVLPAAFVDSAVPPLVLDPLIGGNLSIEAGPELDSDADVAYDATSNNYLVVWERLYSGSDTDVWGQLLDSGGVVKDSMVFELSAGPWGMNPTVANCNLNNRFLVAWQYGPSETGPWRIQVQAVDAFDGSQSDTVNLTSATNPDVDPDAGGEATLLGDEVVVTYEELNVIKARYVTVPPSPAAPVPSTTITISSGIDDSRPAISKSGGSSGQYLVVWQSFFTVPAPGDHDLRRAVIDRDGNILVPESVVATTVGPDEQDPDVDGDGSSFMLVYERGASLGSGNHDIHCRMVTYTGGSSLTMSAATELEGDPGDDEIDPAVGFAGSKYLVAWADEVSGTDYDVTAFGVSPTDCEPCESEIVVDASAKGVELIEIATQLSGSTFSLGDGAWMAWTLTDAGPGSEGNVEAQSWQALGGGAVVSTGGGCGGGGVNGVNGPVAIGNSSFACTLAGADPTAPLAILNFSTGAAPVVCGTCVWYPFGPMTFAKVPAGGFASASVPLPCDLGLVGVVVQTQWTVALTAASPCPAFFNVSLSQRLSMTIGF